MAAGYLAQVTLPSSTNLPADDVVNTFAFAYPAGLPSGVPTLGGMIANFYNETTDQADSIASRISSAISRSEPATVKIYNLLDPEPRAVVEQSSFTLDIAGSNDPLPLEVALCLSFGGFAESGEPKARHRGRVFIGPLATNALTADTVSQPVPETNFMNDLLAAAFRLHSESQGNWMVWSRADNQLHPLNGAFVDNEFDTQRRRGRRATQRAQVGLS